jgi:putative FmdB family regulatory protein
MPLHEYKCGQCGAVFEVLQRFSDEPLAVHEGCGGPVERLLSVPAFQFKGSGFYITDYPKGSKGKNGKNKKEESAAPAAKTESSSTKNSSDPPAKPSQHRTE